VLVEHDLELALHDALVEPGAAEHEPADPVDEGPFGGPVELEPALVDVLIFTTITTMLVAGRPSLGLVVLTCLGGALSAGGAGAINHVLDRDIDRSMARTANRPVASGRVSPAASTAEVANVSARIDFMRQA